jgi:hypothetical protein
MEENEMEEIEVDEPEPPKHLVEIFNSSTCPRCGGDHGYPTNKGGRNILMCLAEGCGGVWPLTDAM